MTVGRRRLLVTGCGRSGSKYITFVLHRLGLDVRHETLGRDGISSWTMAVDAADRPYGACRACTFDHVFHQVREPLATVQSIATFGAESWAFVYAHTPCSPEEPVIGRCARYWLTWNEHAERIAEWRYRVEDLENVLPEFCDRLGIRYDPGILERVPHDVNTRRRGRPLHVGEELFERLRLDMPRRLRTWLAASDDGHALRYEDIAAVDPKLASRVFEKAREYGYRP